MKNTREKTDDSERAEKHSARKKIRKKRRPGTSKELDFDQAYGLE